MALGVPVSSATFPQDWSTGIVDPELLDDQQPWSAPACLTTTP
jgi:hypothetical protein